MSNPFSGEFSGEFGPYAEVVYPPLSILIGGVEWSSVCRHPAMEIVIDSNGRTSTARLEALVQPSDGTFTITPQMSVVITRNLMIIFSGFVSQVQPRVEKYRTVRYSISCQDNTRVLDRVVVASETYTDTSDEDILDDLFTRYLPTITTTGVQGTSPPTVIDSITFTNLTLRQCVDRLCDRTGAGWRLGFDDDLKYYSLAGNVGAFDFSDDADGSASEFYLQGDFGYQEEFNTPANVVTVIGYQPAKPNPATIAVNIAVSSDDGYVKCTAAGTFPPAKTEAPQENTALNSAVLHCTFEANGEYSQALLAFNTSAIPDDAEIQSATLQLTMYTIAQESAAVEFGIDAYAASNWPITAASDYTTTQAGGSAAYTPTAFGFEYIANLALSTSSTVPTTKAFTILAPDTNISKTGYSGFKIFLGIAGTPTGKTNEVLIFTSEHATSKWRPKLTVTYQQEQQPPVTGSYTDAASVALYGTFEKTVSDNGVTTVEEAEARAFVETARYGYPRKSINCTFDRDGLEVGDTVHFTSATLGIDDDYIIQRLKMRWPGRSKKVRYSAELGEARPDLIQYLRKLQ